MSYGAYAAIYDGSGQIRFAYLTALYLEDILAWHPVAGRRLLDVACGTGTLALLFAERGWQVSGLDASSEMLAQAREKSAGSDGDVEWLHGDMRALASRVPAGGYDLVTCSYDSVNYLLSEADLERFAEGLAFALRPGGLAYFDLNTEWFLAYEWERCMVQEQPGLIQVEQSGYDDTSRISTMLLTVFVGDERSGYQRIDEVHLERAYPQAVVAAAMVRAGLVVEAVYDGFTRQPAHATSQRECWVVRRPMEGAA